MQKTINVILLTSLFLILGLLSGCKVESGTLTTGSLLLSFPMLDSKTLQPDISMVPASYDIRGTGPSGLGFHKLVDQSSIMIEELAFGEWVISVEAKNDKGTIIGYGSAACSVHTGETTQVNIVVTPLEGSGSLDLSLSWNAAQTEFPTIESELVPVTGAPIELDFVIAGGNSGSCTKPDIPTGYYTLIIKLFDGNPSNIEPILTMGTVEVVRIINEETTFGTFQFKEINQPGGTIQVNIIPQMGDALEVSLTGQVDLITEADSMTISAETLPEEENVTCIWYVNGITRNTGDEFVVQDFSKGFYRIDAAIFTPDGKRAGSAGWNFEVVLEQDISHKIALVNPDNYRIIKFANLLNSKNKFYSLASATIEDGCPHGLLNSVCWNGVGIHDDFIGNILENAGYEVDYFNAVDLPDITPANYGLLIVQDPLLENIREFDRAVEDALPDLLEHTISETFIRKALNFFNAGGNLLLVGDAVQLLENSESEDKHTFGFNKTVNYDECVNHLSNPDNLVPGKYLFIRGNPFCGANRSGNGTYTVENSVLLDAGTTFADLSLFDGNDIPHCQIWSDTVYFPTDGVSLLDIRVQGSGNYVLSGSTCSPPIYTVSVNDVLGHFMGYTTYNNRKIYYIGSDSFFDYDMINYTGTWHAREFQRINYTITEPAKQAVGSLIEIILNS